MEEAHQGYYPNYYKDQFAGSLCFGPEVEYSYSSSQQSACVYGNKMESDSMGYGTDLRMPEYNMYSPTYPTSTMYNMTCPTSGHSELPAVFTSSGLNHVHSSMVDQIPGNQREHLQHQGLACVTQPQQEQQHHHHGKIVNGCNQQSPLSPQPPTGSLPSAVSHLPTGKEGNQAPLPYPWMRPTKSHARTWKRGWTGKFNRLFSPIFIKYFNFCQRTCGVLQ